VPFANRIFSPNIQKGDERKKTFLIKKHADMHGNCIRVKRGATQEREIRSGAGGRIKLG